MAEAGWVLITEISFIILFRYISIDIRPIVISGCSKRKQDMSASKSYGGQMALSTRLIYVKPIVCFYSSTTTTTTTITLFVSKYVLGDTKMTGQFWEMEKRLNCVNPLMYLKARTALPYWMMLHAMQGTIIHCLVSKLNKVHCTNYTYQEMVHFIGSNSSSWHM